VVILQEDCPIAQMKKFLKHNLDSSKCEWAKPLLLAFQENMKVIDDKKYKFYRWNIEVNL